jgi:hypothetical protein
LDISINTFFFPMVICFSLRNSDNSSGIYKDSYGKTEVIVYDYVDDKVPVLRRMFDRRIKGYKTLGFTVFPERG